MPVSNWHFTLFIEIMKETVSLINQQRTSQSSKSQDFPFEAGINKAIKYDNNSSTMIEKVILSRLQIGDYQAFSNIFNAYYRDMVIFATRFTKDLNHAEEIVQDTFVSFWEDRESLRINTSLKSYLLKSVQNKYIDWFRHNKVIQAHNEHTIEKQTQYALNTDSYLLFSELNEQIEKALNLLPEQVSEAFRMNRNKGLKYHEIADILGVSVRTIEVRIGKALHLLRHYLKDYFVVILLSLALII